MATSNTTSTTGTDLNNNSSGLDTTTGTANGAGSSGAAVSSASGTSTGSSADGFAVDPIPGVPTAGSGNQTDSSVSGFSVDPIAGAGDGNTTTVNSNSAGDAANSLGGGLTGSGSFDPSATPTNVGTASNTTPAEGSGSDLLGAILGAQGADTTGANGPETGTGPAAVLAPVTDLLAGLPLGGAVVGLLDGVTGGLLGPNDAASPTSAQADAGNAVSADASGPLTLTTFQTADGGAGAHASGPLGLDIRGLTLA